MTIYKGTEEHGGSRNIWMIICNNLCYSVPLIFVIQTTVRRNGGIIVVRNNCGEEQLSQGTIVARDLVARGIVARDIEGH